MPPFRSPRRSPATTACLAVALLAAATGCAGAGQAPNSASSASVVPGVAPSLGQASQGALSISAVSIKRQGTKLVISGAIHNSGTAADTLEQIGSQVSPTISLTLPIPAGGTVTLGGSGSNAVLDQQGRLEPGGTVDLTFQFKNGGLLQVFSTFK